MCVVARCSDCLLDRAELPFQNARSGKAFHILQQSWPQPGQSIESLIDKDIKRAVYRVGSNKRGMAEVVLQP